MSTTHAEAQPVGGPILTKPFLGLLAVVLVGGLVILYRFAMGIGAVSGLNDGYPWGIWIAFDVVTGTALACGGYAVAILVYVLNKGRYHPLVRPAILTSALGYTIAGLSLGVDTGRPWNFWKVPIFFTQWNLDSILLEVALCIMTYIVVLWIELSPAFLEKWQNSSFGFLRTTSRTVKPKLERVLIWFVALGMLLPTMHQSSIGGLMMLTGHKLDPLWQTPILPLLFLISCVGMGYAAVVFESAMSTTFFHRKPETRMLRALSGAMVPILLGYVVIRVGDIIVRGQLGRLFAFDGLSLLALAELLMFLVPAFVLWFRRGGMDAGSLFRIAMVMMLAGAAYRFDTFLVAYRPGPGWAYFPSTAEMMITFAFIAMEIMAYLVIVKRFPILSGAPAPAAAAAGAVR
jgi:Ni/Fe-hydrogenase subunit HybB-like protein